MPFTHTFKVTINANTTKANAVKDAKTIRGGSVIDELLLHVPLGHQALQPVWFEESGATVIPSDGTEIALDDVSALVLVKDEPLWFPRETTFALAGYNTDTVNAHTTRAIARGRYANEVRRSERERAFNVEDLRVRPDPRRVA